MQPKEPEGSSSGIQGSDQDEEGDNERKEVMDNSTKGGEWRNQRLRSQDKGDDDEGIRNHDRDG